MTHRSKTMKKIQMMLMVLVFLCLGNIANALTFPVNISDCKIIEQTVGITGWWSQERAYGTHRALDLPVPIGTRVKAPESGTVEIGFEYPKYDRRLKIWRSGFGNYIRLKIYEKRKTVLGEINVHKYSYVIAHLQTVSRLDSGDTVGEGQTIAYSGSTGIVDVNGKSMIAPHIHFQKEDPNGVRINMIYEFGQLIKAYFGSKEKYAFTTMGGGNTNN